MMQMERGERKKKQPNPETSKRSQREGYSEAHRSCHGERRERE